MGWTNTLSPTNVFAGVKLEDYIAGVRARLVEPTAEFAEDETIKDIINIVRREGCADHRLLKRKSSYTATGGFDGIIEIPPDLIGVGGIESFEFDGTEIDIHIDIPVDLTTAGTPTEAVVVDGAYIVPQPFPSTMSSVYMTYYAYPVDLVDGTDTDVLPVGYRDYVELETVAEIERRRRNYEEEGHYHTLAARALSRVMDNVRQSKTAPVNVFLR